jgi:dinuclear metal center YbgI/SA1388 family protein
MSFDRVGLQVGDLDQQVSKAVVSLDRSLEAVKFAGDLGAELLLAHHPLIFTPISSVDTRSHEGRTIVRLLRQGTSFIASHTNWDAAVGGINDTLADLFGLTQVEKFGMGAEVQRLKLAVFCPAEAVESLIDAASSAGAGVIGAYSRCAFWTPGEGTFVGDSSTHPAVGSPEVRERVQEVKLEMSLLQSQAKSVLRAVKRVHPYEEPAIDLLTLRGTEELPLGRVGALPTPMSFKEFASHTDSVLDTRSWSWGDPNSRIKKVAVMGGAADTAWMDAQRAGADVLVTGEVKQHVAVEAAESGMAIIAAGHYQTEQPGCAALATRMQQSVPLVEWSLFTPAPGRAGRPF